MIDSLYQRVQQNLRTLELTTITLHLDQVAQQAATENWSARQFLEALTQLELAARAAQDIAPGALPVSQDLGRV